MPAYEKSALKFLYPAMAQTGTEWCGSDFSVNIEELLKLKPDVVFQWTSQPESIEAMEAAGLKVVALQYGGIEDLKTWLAMLGDLFQKQDRAEFLIDYFDGQIAEVDEVLADLPEDKRPVCLHLSGDLEVYTPESFSQYWIEHAGAKNPVDGSGTSVEVDMEDVYKRQAQRSGRTVEECRQICDDLALRGLLFKAMHSNGEPTYHHLAYVHGFMEQSIPRMYDPEFTAATYDSFLFTPTNPGLVSVGTPIYYAVPCDEGVVSDQRILLLNDYREVIDRNECIAVVPCCCGLREDVRLGADVPPIGSEELKGFRNVFGDHHPLERCLVFGEEAEYYLSIGAGRQITKEETLEILHRNVYEEGLIVQLGYTNNSEVICSCHSDCCGVLGNYRMFDPETLAASPIMKNASNFLLEYDKDACISCGACAQRCPMQAITMGEDGHPEVDIYCVRCGQCGLVCPCLLYTSRCV